MEVVALSLEPYDFRKCSAARPAALDFLHANFAFDLAAALRPSLGHELEIAATGVQTLRYDQFIASLAGSTCLSILRVDPPGAQMCLHLDPQIAHAMIHRLLGGKGGLDAAGPCSSLTQIERGLILQIIERACATLADTWSRAIPLSVRQDGFLIDPTQARIMPDDEMVSIVNFHLRFDDIAGSMSLCLAAPITELLQSARVERPPADSAADRRNLAHNLMQSAVELRVLLAETTLRPGDIRSLQIGDIIATEVCADSVIALRLHDQDVRFGRPAQLHGKAAIEIGDPARIAPAGGQRLS